MQIDGAVVHDRRRVAEDAAAGDRPGAAQLVVERGGSNRDIAVDVAGVVDRDGAAGLDDGVGREVTAAGTVWSDSGARNCRSARVPVVFSWMKIAAWALGATIDPVLVIWVEPVAPASFCVDADAGEARAGDSTVIDDGDVAAAVGDGRHADRADGGAIIGDADVAATVIEGADRGTCGRNRGCRAGRDREVAGTPGERLDAVARIGDDRCIARDGDVALDRTRERAGPARLVAGDDPAGNGAVVVRGRAGVDRAMGLDGDRAADAGSDRSRRS